MEEVVAYNDSIVGLWEKRLEEKDSMAMVEALKGLNGIDFKKLEQKYDRASARREAVRNEIEAAKKDGKPDIIKAKDIFDFIKQMASFANDKGKKLTPNFLVDYIDLNLISQEINDGLIVEE